ncbi:TPA: lytic murein transglycosylase [Legionella pneumophila]|nr:lytic murein transglycosylase [Legionella pneumophila]
MQNKIFFIISKLQFNGLTCYYNWLISLLKIKEGLNPFWLN